MTKWEQRWDALADVPWGMLLFAVVIVLAVLGVLHAEDVRALGTAAGLLGVGHGIHTASKHLPNGKGRGLGH
jgi:hypothetical protein